MTISPHVVIFVLLMLGVVMLTRVDGKRHRHPGPVHAEADSELQTQGESL